MLHIATYFKYTLSRALALESRWRALTLPVGARKTPPMTYDFKKDLEKLLGGLSPEQKEALLAEAFSRLRSEPLKP